MAHPEEAELIVPADLDTLGILPEYLEHAPAEVIAAKCSAAIGYVLSFLGKRAKRPVTAIGDELKEAMVTRAYCQIVRFIGYPPGNGSDEQFKEVEKANEAWLEKVRASGPWSPTSPTRHRPLPSSARSAERVKRLTRGHIAILASAAGGAADGLLRCRSIRERRSRAQQGAVAHLRAGGARD